MTTHDRPETRAESTNSKPTSRIQSVVRASQILLWVAQQPGGATVREIAEANGLALPTTYHLVNTLTDEGFLAKGPDRRYILGRSAAVLARAYLRGRAVPDSLMSAVHALAQRTGETAYLADWGEDEIRVLASVEGSRLVRVAEVSSGEYGHAHARANGKVLLAFAPLEVRHRYLRSHPLVPLTNNTITDPREFEQELAAIRNRGYCLDDEEYAAGVSCIGAPILIDGHLLGALGLSVPTERFRSERTQLIEILKDVLASLHRDIDSPVAERGPQT